MIDAAKYADMVLLMIDGSFGFEMETFEFLNCLQVHGFPKVMGVLTHLDGFKKQSALKKTKKALKVHLLDYHIATYCHTLHGELIVVNSLVV